MPANSSKTYRAHLGGMGCGLAAALLIPPFGVFSGPAFLLWGDGAIVDARLWTGLCQLLGGLTLGNLAVLYGRLSACQEQSTTIRKRLWTGVAVGVILGSLSWMYFHAGSPNFDTPAYSEEDGRELYVEDMWAYWGANGARIAAACFIPISLGIWAQLGRDAGRTQVPTNRVPLSAALLASTAATSLIAVMTIPRNFWYDEGVTAHGGPRWWLGNLLPHGGHVVSLWWWIAPPLWLASILLGAYFLRRKWPTH